MYVLFREAGSSGTFGDHLESCPAFFSWEEVKGLTSGEPVEGSLHVSGIYYSEISHIHKDQG